MTWAPDAELAPVSPTVFGSQRGLVAGNLGFHEPAGNDPIAARYLTGRTISLVWPASGLTARLSGSISNPALVGTNYSVPMSSPFVPTATFDYREGDITDPAPTINVVTFQDASSLAGSGTLAPLAAFRG